MNKKIILLIILVVIPIPFLFKKITMDNQELQRQLNELQQKVYSMDSVRLPYPIDAVSVKSLQRAVSDFLPDLLFDTVWNSHYFYSSVFDSVDGTAKGGTGGTVGIVSGRVEVNTGAVSGNNPILEKQLPGNMLRWDKQQRFRSEFTVDSVTNTEGVIAIGDYDFASPTYYGFRIINNDLYGIVSNLGSSTQTVSLKTLTANLYNIVEARYLPGDGVVFYVDGVQKVKVITNLPGSTTASPAYFARDFFSFMMKTTDANAKIMRPFSFEYIMKK